MYVQNNLSKVIHASAWLIFGCILITSITITFIRLYINTLGLSSVTLTYSLTFLNIIIVMLIKNIHSSFESIFTLRKIIGVICSMFICSLLLSLISACTVVLLCAINKDFCFYLLSHLWSSTGCFYFSETQHIIRGGRFLWNAQAYIVLSQSFDEDRRFFNALLPWLERSNPALYDVFIEWLRYRKIGDLVNQETALFFYTQHRLMFGQLNMTSWTHSPILDEVFMIRYHGRLTF